MSIHFIAGPPGTGKTSFGDWLAKERGFRHIDMEGDFRRTQPLYSLWQKATDGLLHFDAFRNELTRFSGDVVLTWGFPPHAINLAKEISLVSTCWWFDGPREFARAKWLSREGHSDDTYFRIQCDEVDARIEEIKKIFSPNLIAVFRSDGGFVEQRELAARMFEQK